jgi:sugar lactone lactonase YvrE
MKKIFLFGFMFLPTILSGIQGVAQTPKLNNAFYFSSGIVIDSKGNVFVTGGNHKVIKITPPGKAELFAGGGRNDKDGQGKNAGFNNTNGIAIDEEDNLYVTDNTKIRKITPEGMVSTIAGVTNAESKDGDRTTAFFLQLGKIAIDNKGNIYVTDNAPGKGSNSGDNLIRKITPQGIVTTLQNGNTGALILPDLRALACDMEGNLYICANASNCIKKITPAGVITTMAGQCDKKFNSFYKEGSIATAVLSDPNGIAIAKNGDIYFSDASLNRIFKIAGNMVISIAGAGKMSFNGNPYGVTEPGEKDGKALQATFDIPAGIVFDKTGNLYIVDGSGRTNSYIRKLSPDGIVSTFCKHLWNPKTQQYEEAD